MLGEPDSPLAVEIADDKILNVASVYKGCVIEISGVKFPIDLIPNMMKEINVIVRMDWLGCHQAMIDCERQWIRVQTASGGVMWSFHTIKTPSNFTQKLFKLNYHNTDKYDLNTNSIELISTRYRSIHWEQFYELTYQKLWLNYEEIKLI